MIIYICDRCKEEIKKGEQHNTATICGKGYDLCRYCYHLLVRLGKSENIKVKTEAIQCPLKPLP